MNEQALRQRQHAYTVTGGLATGDQLAHLLQPVLGRAVSTVARWIVDRRIVSFVADGVIWVPLCQIALQHATPQPGLAPVLELLNATHDDDALAQWFVEPHALLQGRTPAALLRERPEAVREAAEATARTPA